MSPVFTRFLLGMALLLAPFPPAVACGPDFPTAIFVIGGGPDDPEAFVRGRLGIILPSFDPLYLATAYRQLSGAPLTAAEEHAVTAPREPEKPDVRREMEAWLADRAAIPGLPTIEGPNPYGYLEESYMNYLNCTADSFTTARRTLRERLDDYGPLSSEMKEWVAAQDQVFANCNGKDLSIPQPLPAKGRPLARADRDYQIAAAYFYARNFEEAAKRFKAIGANPASPWRELAPYLAARALVRKGTLVPEGKDFDAAILGEAEKEVQAILADKGKAKLHDNSRRLLAYIEFRLRPAQRLAALGTRLGKPAPQPLSSQELRDFQLLAERSIGSGLKQLDPALLQVELIDWIATLGSRGDSAEKHAFERWKARKSTLWLVAALSVAGGGDPGVGEILDAAARVKEDDPAYASVAFYRAHLLAQSGKTPEARKLLRALAAREEIGASASGTNLVRAALLQVADSLQEYLASAPRRVAAEVSTEGSEPGDPKLELFDEDAARQLTWGVPLDTIKEGALQDTVKGGLRTDLLVAATVRGMVLERPDVVRELAPLLKDRLPDMTGALDDYLGAVTDEDRDFAATVLMLKFPGALPYVHPGLRVGGLTGIDSYSEKWWCDLHDPDDTPAGEDAAAPQPVHPPFLTSAQRAQAEKEREELNDLDHPLNLLTERVIERAKTHPEDRRVPEALHRVISYARYGCTDEDTRKLSKQAFLLLHKKYPKDPWAKKTKYWY